MIPVAPEGRPLVKKHKHSKSMDKTHKIIVNSNDFTSEVDFDGTTSKWLYEKCLQGDINKVNGSLIGVKDKEGKAIILDNLMSENYLNLSVNKLFHYL